MKNENNVILHQINKIFLQRKWWKKMGQHKEHGSAGSLNSANECNNYQDLIYFMHDDLLSA